MTEQGGHVDPSAALQQRARAFADDLLAAPPRSPAFAAKVASITSMGEPDVRAAAALTERFLRRDAVGGGHPDPQGFVAATMARLREVIARLDPSGVVERAGRSGASGLQRLLRRQTETPDLGAYFRGYAAAEGELDEILTHLVSGQDSLRRDNATIEVDRQAARDLLARLGQYGDLSARLDTLLTEAADGLEASGQSDAATVLRSDALASLRQRRVDLATSQAVTAQGQLVLDVVQSTNLELIRGVERARQTTLVALRTAVTVARARAEHQLVLDRIAGLGAATEAALAPGSSADDLTRLEHAFAEVRASLDAVDTVQARAREALPTESGR